VLQQMNTNAIVGKQGVSDAQHECFIGHGNNL
jgi:hypothetical protein